MSDPFLMANFGKKSEMPRTFGLGTGIHRKKKGLKGALIKK